MEQHVLYALVTKVNQLEFAYMRASLLTGMAMGMWLVATLSGIGAQALVSWEAPRFNIDGSAVTNLAGFKVYYGTQAGTYSQVQAASGSPTLIANLDSQKLYYFAVTAVSADGVESSRSTELSWETPAVPVPAQLAVSTQVVNLVAVKGEAIPTNRMEVWNAGEGELTYAVGTLPAWLTCTPTSGRSTGEHDPLTLSAPAQGLTLGVYTSTVAITGQATTGGVSQAKSVTVTLTLKGRFYRDADHDGYGSSQSTLAFAPPAGYVTASGDLSDANAAIHPGALESNNGLDDDCDGAIDENFIPVATLDFDGDVRADVVVFESASGNWRVRGSEGRDSQLAFGYNGTIPLAEDFDGDLVTDYAVFAPVEGRWYYVSSATGGVTTVVLGNSASVPTPADFDGDGKVDAAVFTPSTRQWTVRPSSGGPDRSGKFGSKGSVPVPADYDGDGKADVAVFYPPTATWSGIRTSDGKQVSAAFGTRNAVPVPADYDGDGVADVATYSAPTGLWRIRESASQRVVEFAFGYGGTVPVPGDYDGDGLADLCLYDPTTGTWFTHYSGGGDVQQTWGSTAGRPVLPQYQINRMSGLCP